MLLFHKWGLKLNGTCVFRGGGEAAVKFQVTAAACEYITTKIKQNPWISGLLISLCFNLHFFNLLSVLRLVLNKCTPFILYGYLQGSLRNKKNELSKIIKDNLEEFDESNYCWNC